MMSHTCCGGEGAGGRGEGGGVGGTQSDAVQWMTHDKSSLSS